MMHTSHHNNKTGQRRPVVSARTKTFLTTALLLATFSTLADAQQSTISVVAPNGMRVPVSVMVMPGFGDIARGGNGTVLVDPALLAKPWEFQQAVLAHEAAHAIGIMDETAADYFAGQMLRIAGFGPSQMQVVFASMAAFLGPWGDATHLPVRSRIQVVLAGYNGQ